MQTLLLTGLKRYVVVGNFGGLAVFVVAGGGALFGGSRRAGLTAVSTGTRTTVFTAREKGKIVHDDFGAIVLDARFFVVPIACLDFPSIYSFDPFLT